MREEKKIIRVAIKLLKNYPLCRIRPDYLKTQYSETFKVLAKADKHFDMIQKLKGD